MHGPGSRPGCILVAKVTVKKASKNKLELVGFIGAWKAS